MILSAHVLNFSRPDVQNVIFARLAVSVIRLVK